MKIGIFDSGLGGLFTLKAISKKIPEYDYIYLGDTKRLPYGSRSSETIYQFLKEGIDFLFSKNCALIIVACNTASSEALRKLQIEYLPQKYPNQRVLGMIIPLAEECLDSKKIGLIATEATISSGAYPREINKRFPSVKIFPLATPLLVPIIENEDKKIAIPILEKYLKHFNSKKIDTLILGCTHYAILKNEIKNILPENIKIISQDVVIPKKIKDYLSRHAEIEKLLSKNSKCEFFVTDLTDHFKKTASNWFGKKIEIKKISIEK